MMLLLWDLDGVHEAARRGVLLAAALVDAEFRERPMPHVEQRRGPLEVVARGGAARVVAQHRGAAGEQRRIVVGGGARQRGLARGGLRLALGDEEDHDHDEPAAHEVPPGHGRVQPEEREDHGRHGLDAAQQAGLHGTRVVDALQVQHVGAQRAHEHDGHERGEAARRQVDRHGPGLDDEGGRGAAEQHGEARHQHGAPLLQHVHGHERVEGERHGRDEAPRKALHRDGQLVDLALRGDDEHAAEREHEAHRLAQLGKALRAHAHVQHDEHEAHLLDGGAHARARVADGVEVAELGEQHAEDGERRDLHERAPVAEYRHEVAPVLDGRQHEEEHRGDHHAHAGDPRGRRTVIVHEQLGAGTRKSPANAARKSAHDPARDVAVPRHRSCFRHVILRKMFPIQPARPRGPTRSFSRAGDILPVSSRKTPGISPPHNFPRRRKE